MAEINVERKPAGNYTPILAALSVLMIVGFFWWLGATAEPTSGPVVMEEDTADAGAVAITLEDLQGDMAAYQGERVRVAEIRVASRMGTQAFWTQLPNDQPLLMKLDSALVASGESVSGGERVGVVGTVRPMTDSVLDAWERLGAIRDEGERMEAEFAQQFFEVARVDRGQAGQGRQGRRDQRPSGS